MKLDVFLTVYCRIYCDSDRGQGAKFAGDNRVFASLFNSSWRSLALFVASKILKNCAQAIDYPRSRYTKVKTYDEYVGWTYVTPKKNSVYQCVFPQKNNIAGLSSAILHESETIRRLRPSAIRASMSLCNCCSRCRSSVAKGGNWPQGTSLQGSWDVSAPIFFSSECPFWCITPCLDKKTK